MANGSKEEEENKSLLSYWPIRKFALLVVSMVVAAQKSVRLRACVVLPLFMVLGALLLF